MKTASLLPGLVVFLMLAVVSPRGGADSHGIGGTQGTNVTTTDPFNYPPPGAGGNGTAGADGGALHSTGALTIAKCWFHGNKAGTGGHGGLGGRV